MGFKIVLIRQLFRFHGQDSDLALTYLLLWALQEELIRSPGLPREERLKKTILSFGLLFHYFDMSFLPQSKGITQQFDNCRTVAVTFAKYLVWPRILNFTLTIIRFILAAPSDWSFSRLGTHCLENFSASCGRKFMWMINPWQPTELSRRQLVRVSR
jgi:hypothetical protein